MSEEKQVEETKIVDETVTTHTESVQLDPEVTPAEGPAEEKNKMAGMMTPIVFLLFMIFAMVVVLVVSNMKRGKTSTQTNLADDPAVAALKADVDARRNELNRQRMAMGLPPIEGSSEPLENIAERLKNDADTLVNLSNRFQQMLAEKDTELSRRNSEILRLEKLRQDVSAENSRIQAELQRALLGSADNEQLKRMFNDVKSQRDALSDELATTRKKLNEMSGSVNEEEFADLQRRFQETLRSKEFFENRVKELEAQLGKMNLFAKSEDELLPAAVELFRRLRKLEGLPDSDLTTEYSKLGVDLGANVLHTLHFKTGSSELTQTEQDQLKHIIEDDVPDGDLVLIVGYASTTGDAAANETLSSNRATAGAEFFASRKRSGQRVQAVYLGQTDRFSSRIPERNQICEVWRIRQK
ncbi:OmpA family protein [Luteolibacter algae]|uniref:OmpA family protein n=1 Tax=Luteolibacter algae TaxID=454151 RepID=A0ABW5D5Q3_9BACT